MFNCKKLIVTLTAIFFVMAPITFSNAGNGSISNGNGSITHGSGYMVQTRVYSDTTIGIAWDAVDDATGYKLYQSFDGGEFELIATTEEISVTEIEIQAGRYVWYVTAYNDIEESDASIPIIIINNP